MFRRNVSLADLTDALAEDVALELPAAEVSPLLRRARAAGLAAHLSISLEGEQATIGKLHGEWERRDG
jgi:hypothetical protein